MNFSQRKMQALMKPKGKALSTFLLALMVAAAFIVPFMVYDGGYFLFFGDFNVQQVPFYKLAHEAIRSGNIGWNWNTDLGANFISSYTFYLLGSPFFWLTLPFPTNFLPFLMGPLLIIKIALSALTAYIYLNRFTRKPETARLCALLYAFSGFSVYNIFFNHFHEAIIIFPLLLYALELFITENKRGGFAAAVFISAFMNYFFFFGMVVFCIIYYIVRTCSGCYKQKFSRFLWMCFEAVIGLSMAAVLLVPSVITIMQNSRVSEFLIGWNGIVYGKEQIYLNVLQCFFFPPDLPARPVFFPGADVKWSSLGGWLPLFSMVGVFAYLQNKKRTWLRRMLGILIFMALVPILNSAFYMFNASYYARWYYMPVLLMCLATARCIEETEINWSTPFKWVLGITVATVAVIGLFPSEMKDGKITKLGLYTPEDDCTYLVRFAITSAIAVISLIVLGLLLRIIKKQRNRFIAASTATVCIISALYGAYFIGTGKTHSYDVPTVMVDSLLEEQVELPGDSNTYRIDVYDGVDNTAMFLGYSSINAFHSIVPTSVTDFWEYLGEERGVASRPGTDTYAARALLGVKYLLARDGGDAFTDEMGETAMAGFDYLNKQKGYTVFENKNYLPYGFTYDYYMTAEQCEATATKSQRANMMLKAALLDQKQIEKYGYCLNNIDTAGSVSVVDVTAEETAQNAAAQPETAEQPFDSESFEVPATLSFMDCTEEQLSEDVANRRAGAVTNFVRTANGFTAEINLQKDNLVFFSVPYEQGWSATVNQSAATVEKVNVGFMAVLCHAGQNTIAFTYQTPGLELGVKITLLALLIWLLYVIVCAIMKKNGHLAVPEYPEGEKMIEQWKKDELAEEKEQLPTQEETDFLGDAAKKKEDESFYNRNFTQGFFVVEDNADSQNSAQPQGENTFPENQSKE